MPGAATRPPVTAVLLDLDDTLVDTQRAFRLATGAVARQWLSHLSADEVLAAARRWAADPGGHFRAYTRGELAFGEQRRRRVDDLQSAYGGEVLDDAGFAAWNAEYDRAFRAGWTLHDDAVGLLDDLVRAGVPHGALTNASRELSTAKLLRLGLADRLEVLVSPEDLGFGKPDPRVFALACHRLGSDPATTAYVGDELDIDAEGARAAGLVGVWLDRSAGPVPGGSGEPVPERPPVLVAHSLADVPRLLDLGALDGRR